MEICTFEQITPDAADTVGGKALSLGLMAGAGLPVPPGFCVTTAVYRRAYKPEAQARDPLVFSQPEAQARDSLACVSGWELGIEAAYRTLGGGLVAVRSSATTEDGAVTSFAGQQETFLGVHGEAAVLDAVKRCWASLHSDRAVAYRRKQGVADAGLAMAVVVQRLVPADVSGVLFTRDPLDPEGRRMLVEAAWGLGESVVSGKVTPDRYHLDPDSGTVLVRHVAIKRTMLTAEGSQEVPAERQTQNCLNDSQLAELAGLGRQVEGFYGEPRDIEWAWAEGKCWLLQARPITAGGAAERAQVRREEIAVLAARAEPGGTVWSRFNLSEILPEPTPLTWSIVRLFMSGKGGYGLMYRDLGFDPDPALDEDGVFDLVCGRPYCNLSREPLLLFRQLPFEHPFARLKADPAKALYPQPVINPGRAGWRFWLTLPLLLPVLFFKLMRAELRVRRLGRTLADRLRKEIFPTFAAEVKNQAAQDLSPLSIPALRDRLEHWIRRTLYDFARDSLKPTALAGVAFKNIEKLLVRTLGPEKTTAALGELTLGIRPDPEVDLAGAVEDLSLGRLDRETFLERFGHRGNEEMELVQPRWAEDPAALGRLLAVSLPMEASRGRQPPEEASPGADAPGSPGSVDRIAAEAKLSDGQKKTLEAELATLRTYLALRETAKHYLMRGYAQIRRLLLELDRRFGLNGGIFFLTLDDLPALAEGKDLSTLIAQRRRRRSVALSLEVPQVLFSDDLEAIGRPTPVSGADTLQGVPLSAGVAEGPALVLAEPEGAVLPSEPYILVCPTTDPAWVPLFVKARGLVMETGGVLSHGAIVAREFGLPAVAGLPDVLRRVRTGQRLRVDGSTGVVAILPES